MATAIALRVTQPAPSCPEHELVAAVRRGDDRAFEELFARYRGRIGSYIFGMVGDYARAEDIAQDVFISALRRLRETERPIAFKPWIYEIAKNACIDEFRRTRRAQEVPLDADEDSPASGRGLCSRDPAPDVALESKQRLVDLQGAFHGLSENHHRVLVLRELEGLSYREIGERLGMSRPVVESTLFRARRRLSEEYEELVSGRRCAYVRALIDNSDVRSLRSLGVRERRQFARHLAHCQPCRRQAKQAGFDDAAMRTPGLAAKVAALLPLPWLRWRRSNPDDEAWAGAGSHSLVVAQSVQSIARIADAFGPSLDLGRAAAAAAALAMAGAGGGLVSGLGLTPGSSGGAASAAASAASSSRSPAAAATSSLVAGVSPFAARASGTSAGAVGAATGQQGSTGASGGSAAAAKAAAPALGGSTPGGGPTGAAGSQSAPFGGASSGEPAGFGAPGYVSGSGTSPLPTGNASGLPQPAAPSSPSVPVGGPSSPPAQPGPPAVPTSTPSGSAPQAPPPPSAPAPPATPTPSSPPAPPDPPQSGTPAVPSAPPVDVAGTLQTIQDSATGAGSAG